MLRAEIDWLICQSCHPCEARSACNTRAIMKIDPDEPAYVELSRCNGCSKCLTACLFGAITMKNLNGSINPVA
jgi:Fe-S-cluster-containing hydrogenase component 2